MSQPAIHVQQPERLDKIVSGLKSVGSRSRARKAIASGKVDVDGHTCTDPGTSLSPGSVVTVHMNRPGTATRHQASERAMADAGLQVIYQDNDVIAVNKPAGMLTDTASVEQHRHRDSVRKRLRALLRSRDQRARVVHRIDRDTTGVVLFACTEDAEARLRKQFRGRQPERVYHALVQGLPTFREARWKDYTRWHKGRRILESVYEKTPGGVETLCDVRVLRTFVASAEIEVRLTTGRRNQIRLQACLRGLPLVGERLYLPDNHHSVRAADRQCLHAAQLVVVHPTTGLPLTLRAPPPPDWRRVVDALQNPDR